MPQMRRAYSRLSFAVAIRSSVSVSGYKNGGKGGSRTHDTGIFSPLLYQLSYLATETKKM